MTVRNARSQARHEAYAQLAVFYPDRAVLVDRIIEDIDKGDLARLAFRSLEGAVRAAAKRLGRRIDAEGYIQPAS